MNVGKSDKRESENIDIKKGLIKTKEEFTNAGVIE